MAKRIAVELFIVLLIGFALGLIGPFGTYNWPAVAGLIYWMLLCVTGYAIFRPLGVAGKWLSETLHIPPFVGIGLALVVATAPMTVLVGALLFKMDLAAMLGWQGLSRLYFQVWLIGFLTNGLFQIIFRNRKASSAPAADLSIVAPPITDPAFFSRLPQGFGTLLALKGEDHYVRAMGVGREQLVLIRLRDAVSELAGTEGMAVHRSWWVAREAVRSYQLDGRTLILKLSNEQAVPVARAQARQLRSLRWLDHLPKS